VNESCAIILGIGGKPERLVDVNAAKKDGVLVLKRFSGGGTVVVDHDSLWTTFIGRNEVKMGVSTSGSRECVKPFPREIMEWSADIVFGPTFDRWNEEIDGRKSNGSNKRKGRQTLVFKGKSCGFSGGVGEALILPPEEGDEVEEDSTTPKFQLRENDYVLGERKMGGNAQSIVSGGFLHHTSFLWDFDNTNMEYLTIPEKRPDYRGNRSHDDFLAKLKNQYGKESTKSSFFAHLKQATGETYELEEATLNDVIDIANEQFGGLQEWFDGKCRTKVLKL